MPSRHAPPRRLLLATAWASAPALLALAFLAAGGWLALRPALIAAVGVVLAVAVLVRLHLTHLQAIAGDIRAMAAEDRGRTGRTPRGPAARMLGPELSEAAAEAGKAWTARRRELEAVAAANETVLANLPDPLILIDGARRILRLNQAAESILGAAPLGRDLVAVLRNPPLIEAVDRVLAGGGGGLIEFSLPVPVERIFTARVEPLALGIADGPVALVTLHDVTEIKRVDRMRADFVANVSHELRTPLSTLIGFVETLRGPARDDAETRDRFLAIMQEQAARMARLVADLLSLSRIELHEHNPPTGRVELAGILHGVADTLQFKAAKKGMSIALAPDLAALPPVAGDADELEQVFQNLIDNAVKYGREGTAVRVSGRLLSAEPYAAHPVPASRRLPGNAVAIAVTDEGEGIARDHLPRLTERFYRVDTARSRDLGGTGLGLAIVKHIVNRHRGALEIDSVVGEGSTVTIHLRAATEKTPGARGPLQPV